MSAENGKTRTKGKMSMKDAAVKLLEEAGGPLKSNDICDEALKRKLIATEGETPRATMAAQLAVDSKKKDSRFLRTKAGVYGLKGRDRKGQAPKEIGAKAAA